MEEVLAVIPGFEIWGINHKSPCNIVLSTERMVVVKAPKGARLGLPRRNNSPGVDAYLQGDHYSLPFKSIRWVEIRYNPFGALAKMGTPGGSYRFRLRRRPSRRLAEKLKQLLGDKVREPGR